jgi:hypothetical protein
VQGGLLWRRAHENWADLCGDNMCIGATCQGSLRTLGRLVRGQHVHWDYLSQGGHEHWGDLLKGGVVQGRIKVISYVCIEKNRLGTGWEVALDLSSSGTGFELYNASRFGSENKTAGF